MREEMAKLNLMFWEAAKKTVYVWMQNHSSASGCQEENTSEPLLNNGVCGILGAPDDTRSGPEA